MIDETYSKDEPLFRSIDVSEEDNCSSKENYTFMIQQGLSLMAVDDKTGQIIGVRLNVPTNRHQMTAQRGNNSAKAIQLYFFFEFASKAVNVCEKYGVENIFSFQVLSVHPNYRRLGIATKLVQKSIELARSRGFEVVKAEATAWEIFTETIHQT